MAEVVLEQKTFLGQPSIHSKGVIACYLLPGTMTKKIPYKDKVNLHTVITYSSTYG